MRPRNLTAWVAIALLASAGAASAIDPAARGYGVGEPGKGDSNLGTPVEPNLTGGPDGFGYTFIDSNEAGGPTYSFVDISGSGTSVALGDDASTSIPIGFTFGFYGTSYTNVSASSNGYLTFGADGTDFSNDCPLITGGTTPPLSIFPLWDDLNPAANGALLYHQSYGSCPVGDAIPCLIVQWENYQFFSGGLFATFEAVLYGNGNMLFQYEGGTGIAGTSATTGIWQDTLANSLIYQCNAGALSGGLAVLFELPPIGDLVVTKTGDVALGGPYAYTIEVTNNGPDDQTGVAATDVLPAELIYVGDTCGGDFADGVWDIGALANGASVSCDLIVSLVDPNTCVDVVNTVTVTGDLFDPAGGSTAVNSNAGGNLVQDPGFELGTPNPSWAESSTNFGTPLCDTMTCNPNVGSSAHTGTWWAWYGGITAFEEGAVSQSISIPVGANSLSFWVEVPTCGTGGAADFLEMTIDGNQLYYVDSTSPACGVVGYVQQVIDISAYADGGAHTVAFHSVTASGQISNFFVDDVELLSVTTCPGVPIAPPAPNILEIPTLQTTGLVLFGLVLAFAALLLVRRRGIA